ncbi:hypothetical protein BBD31_01595 [Elizabethkingia anophelis]|uniref:hypothetical protein n=1 Tax=Elizabethkingia anophelis TaxID=1117645 RepID=UPI000994D952|nr:hypothetical protein [Elizabethkingia anophelis]AQW96668.1 hypothetical protein BBD31_01595 [Elizabethkingia anophelis]MDV3673663.1 hypothetical protein [Elizabethkingia anophelis]MDV3692387.1 hypothetical protein [Elizabethkingia anophelis]MDV3706656.1 hypothetical protein [Elizabethkingia anophelis]OPB50082.1 hypothetical protein BAY04_06905 [Elizabethkingia anophelis]
MNCVFTISQGIEILLFIGITFYFKNYIANLLKEKAKNLATRQDIGKITAEVKKVESMFTVKTSGEIDYLALKRKVILDFYGSLNSLETIVMSSFSKFSDNWEFENNELVKECNNSYNNYKMKEGEVLLFLNDNEFIDMLMAIGGHIINSLNLFETHCIKVKHTLNNNETNEDQKFEIMSSLKADFYEKRGLELDALSNHKVLLIKFIDKCLKDTFK